MAESENEKWQAINLLPLPLSASFLNKGLSLELRSRAALKAHTDANVEIPHYVIARPHTGGKRCLCSPQPVRYPKMSTTEAFAGERHQICRFVQ
ncbi:hypothetical protein NQZ68_001495 [Dissostichus eleginoides]|nr:hypothetical protein NQZ68_001495 [Dissostichus eleginoides]